VISPAQEDENFALLLQASQMDTWEADPDAITLLSQDGCAEFSPELQSGWNDNLVGHLSPTELCTESHNTRCSETTTPSPQMDTFELSDNLWPHSDLNSLF